jgi:hypothetical protein
MNADPAPAQSVPAPRRSWLRRVLTKAASVVLTGLLLGFAYDWAAPRFYHSEQAPGFPMALLHGALMPVALPSLLMGKDVPIYSPAATGRIYKIGYICGINLCGLLFFGLMFRPAREDKARLPAA